MINLFKKNIDLLLYIVFVTLIIWVQPINQWLNLHGGVNIYLTIALVLLIILKIYSTYIKRGK